MCENPVAEAAAGEIPRGDRFQLVVHFDRMQLAADRQAPGHANGRVAGERADFEYAFGREHPHEHFEQPALHVSREHARLYDAQVRLAVEFPQKFVLGRDMRLDISFQIVHRHLYSSIDRFRSENISSATSAICAAVIERILACSSSRPSTLS